MNFYSAILVATTLAGMGLCAWGWSIMKKSREMEQWPRATGKIETIDHDAKDSDSLPEIIFSYQVSGKNNQRKFEFPEGTHPLPELINTYKNKYPVGASVEIFYNPEQNDIATLEPSSQGDCMILVMGIAFVIGGALSLILS